METRPIGSETGQAVLAPLRNVKYRRSLMMDLLSANNTQTHLTRPGDLKVAAKFEADGDPWYLSVEFWFDRVFVDISGKDRYVCSVSHHDELAQELLVILQPLATETRTER